MDIDVQTALLEAGVRSWPRLPKASFLQLADIAVSQGQARLLPWRS
jgi:hypothetical protein